MRTESIVRSVSLMEPAELTDFVRSLRRSRETVKEVSNIKRPTAVKEKTTDKALQALKNLSPDQLAKLKQLALLLKGGTK